MRLVVALLAALGSATVACAQVPAGCRLIAGTLEPGRGPDGNSVFLDAPDGLILVDTGRHPAHRDRLLAYARERGRPIVAIVNTHWHLDHTTGNGELRAAFPRAQVYASNAIEGALTGFLARSRASIERQRAAGRIPEANLAEVQRAFDAMDHPDMLRPTRPVIRSGEIRIGGRRLQVNLAAYAATEGDVWLYDAAARLAIVGDLVVAPVPFMDTACPEGWRQALDEIAATPFTTLIPGHGAPMDRSEFLAWRAAYANLVDCGASRAPQGGMRRRLAARRGAIHPGRARGDGRPAGRLLYRHPPALPARGAAALLPAGAEPRPAPRGSPPCRRRNRAASASSDKADAIGDLPHGEADPERRAPAAVGQADAFDRLADAHAGERHRSCARPARPRSSRRRRRKDRASRACASRSDGVSASSTWPGG